VSIDLVFKLGVRSWPIPEAQQADLSVSFGENRPSKLIHQRRKPTLYRYSHPFSTILVIADRYLSVSAGRLANPQKLPSTGFVIV